MDYDQFKLWLEGYLLAKTGLVLQEDDVNTIIRNYNFMTLMEEEHRLHEIVPLEDTLIKVDPASMSFSNQEAKMAR